MSIKNDFNARLISGNEPFKEITAGMDRNCKGKLEEHTSVFLNNGTSSNARSYERSLEDGNNEATDEERKLSNEL